MLVSVEALVMVPSFSQISSGARKVFGEWEHDMPSIFAANVSPAKYRAV
jgi:hypothetical protein